MYYPKRNAIVKTITVILMLVLSCSTLFMTACTAEQKPSGEGTEASRAEQILSGMSLDGKISQMIIPAIRTWNEEDVTDLSKVPELAEALRAHQYGGIILFGSNVSDTEQLARLVSDLQVNNAQIEGASAHIPYFLPLDEEGGIVTRLTMGTRMTGNMAIGATGDHGADNAFETGKVIGEELKALGFNIDFAPDIDVNNNAANPVIGTRSFSDDANRVAELGTAYANGLAESQIIATYKHFPGHGDTGTDSHIGTPSVEKTYEQIKQTELVPFAAAIGGGADLIMTAHITYPLIDEEKVFGDGETKGYYPATMSRKMIQEILRTDMGYEGVVVTDALEMDAIRTAGLVPGEQDSTQYQINIAQEVINAGVDILLLPLDMTNADAVKFYDDYIAGLEEKVKSGSIDEQRIDESVLRILNLKDKYGILDADISGDSLDQVIAAAAEQVGSVQHHEKEMEIARQAITLVKNENEALPVKAQDQHIVILGRNADDNMTIAYTLGELQKAGAIGPETEIVNLVTGEVAGAQDSGTKITIDYYYDYSGDEPELHYTEALRQAIREADVVIGLTKTFSLDALGKDSLQYQGIANAIADTHAASARFILLSDNLPYDAARYQDADAIVLAYMGSGLDLDPTARADGSANPQAYNANVVAALQIIFGDGTPQGTLPVNIPTIAEDAENGLSYTDEILYERGFGITEDTK